MQEPADKKPSTPESRSEPTSSNGRSRPETETKVGEPKVDRRFDEGLGFPVVGIGSSAGGLESLKQFLSAMPTDTGMAFILVQHLDPNHESMMAEILAKNTDMPVLQADEDTPVKPNHVYVIPPGRYLALREGRLRLSEPVKVTGMRMPIDFLFRSLAEECGSRAICVVLSGTASDGSRGLVTVKDCGGMAIAEDPGSAGYDGMPRSAIGTGLIDFVLPAGEIPGKLVQYVRHPYVATPEDGHGAAARVEGSDHFQEILAVLRTRTGYDFRSYKTGTLSRRIDRRLGLHHLEKLSEYVELLREDPEEVSHLFRDLLISVTSFFRDAEAWRELEREVLVGLVKRKGPDETIRVWIPGCATGEEAYSLAILLEEQLARNGKSLPVQIYATDIDEEAVQRARSGVYSENIASEVSRERLEKFFVREGDYFQVKKRLRESVVFAIQNLISDPPFSKLDLICCRNLLIYLNSDIQRKLISMFHFGLGKGGYLFLGNSEATGPNHALFKQVSTSSRLYRKIEVTSRAGDGVPLLHERVPKTSRSARSPEFPSQGDPGGLAERARRELLDRFAPASVLINRRHEALYFHGRTRDFLDYPTGEPTRDILLLIEKPLKNKVRSAVHQAVSRNEPVTVLTPRVELDGDETVVRISVTPLPDSSSEEDYLLVTFEKVEPGSLEAGVPPAASKEEADAVAQMEYELNSVREDLQSTIEELETSNEELKASNEEVMSMNEEFQSTNEELETSREELQSLNEELNTLNCQLEEKLSELEATNNDLNNLLSSTDVATLFLDSNLRIRRFTPAILDLVRLLPTDIGRPFSDIATKFIDRDLLPDAEAVIHKLVPIERRIGSETGRTYIRRVLPYRTENNRIDGVVITFSDVSEMQQQAELLITREHQQAAVAALGSLALQEAPLQELLQRACKRIGRVLDLPLVKVLELTHDRKEFTLRAGLGWKKGLVGKAVVSAGVESQAGYTLESAAPVVVKDLREEKRFQGPPLLSDHHVISGLSVSIGGPDQPWGVLGAHCREKREFHSDDLNFLQAISNILYQAIEADRSRRELRVSEERYRLVTDAMPVLIAYCDADLVYRFCNAAYEAWFGMPPEQIIGRPLVEVIGDDAFAKIEKHVRRALAGERCRFRNELPYKHGPARYTEVEYIPHRSKGEVIGYYAMIQDVTARMRAEEAQQRLATIVETSEDLILACDTKGRIQTWNRGAEKLLGFKAQEMVGRKLEELVTGDQESTIRELFPPSSEMHSTRTAHEFSVNRRDGKILEMSVTLSPLVGADGEVTGVSLIARDITDRKRMEKRKRLALEAGEIGTWERDLQTGDCIFDQRICRLFGFPSGRTTCTDDDFIAKVHPGDLEDLRKAIERSEETGEFNHEFRILPDGKEIRWVLGRAQLIRDHKGRPRQLFGINLDITQRKESERLLLEHKRILEDTVADRTQELKAIADNVPAFFAYLDSMLHLRFVNRAMAEAYRWKPEGIEGMSVTEAFSKESLVEMLPRFREALNGNERQFELGFSTPELGHRIFRVRCVPRREEEGTIIGLFLLASDITAERQLQQEVLDAAEKEKARIGRDLHDSICQELNGIGLFGKALAEELRQGHAREAEEAEKLVAKINVTTQRARKLARGLSPIELEDRTLVQALADFCAEIHAINDQFECRFQTRIRQLKIDHKVGTQLFLIAREAILNAAQHGSPSVIEVTLTRGKRRHVHLVVSDDGGGSLSELREGLGIRSMRYRARTIGGRLTIGESHDAKGIEVCCDIETC